VTATAPAGRPLARPFPALVGYAVRACLPRRRWFGVLAPCAGAVLFGWLARVAADANQAEDAVEAFSGIADGGLFRLILPLACLIIGDAVLGADLRAGTLPLTWLSPVPFRTIAFARWLGGWLIALVTVVPAMALAGLVAGLPEAVGPLVAATAAGAAAYIALFLVIGIVVRRSALWSLAVVLLGEWLLGTALAGVAQLSPLWMAMQAFAGLWSDGEDLLRAGVPEGTSALIRLAGLTLVFLLVAAWRLAHLRPLGRDD
jgi:hypothetical protein